MAIEAIYEHPDDYDLEVASRDVVDLPFWRDVLLRERPAQVLEIGAGSGRLTLPLARLGAEHGFSVTGLEPERAMLESARERQLQERANLSDVLRFVSGDVLSMYLSERYDVVLLPYGAAHHLVTLDEQIAAWRNIRRHLTPRGLFCIEVCPPDYHTLAQAITGTLRHEDLEARGDGCRKMLRTVASRYAPATQVITHAYEYQVTDRDGGGRCYPSAFAMHVYFPHQMELLCRYTGFTVEAMLGSYAGEPFGDHSELMITLARACD